MKTAELQKDKSYLVWNRDHWIGAGYGQTYYRVANSLKSYRYTLSLNSEGKIATHNSKVLMQDIYGRKEWIVLRHIRAEFFEAVALIAKTNRQNYDENAMRGKRYAKHLAKKAERERNEREKPIKEQFFQLIRATSKHHVSGYDRVEQLPIETMQAIADALLKTGVKA